MVLTVMPLMIGTTELLLIVALALLMFGGKKLPEMMRGLGKGVRSFKEGLNEEESTKKQQEEVTEKPAAPAQLDDDTNSEVAAKSQERPTQQPHKEG